MSLITTPGATDANSYISLADADAYFDDRYGSASDRWAALTDPVKEGLLRQSTKKINKIGYVGAKWSNNQSLQFPRSQRHSTLSTDASGDLIVPIDVQDATCECSLWLIVTDGDEALAQTMARGINSQSAGKISYSGMSANGSTKIGPLAHDIMKSYYRKLF